MSKSIVGKKKAFKGVKMTTAKWTINNNTREQQDLHYLAARFNE
jgi:hypothetical protein